MVDGLAMSVHVYISPVNDSYCIISSHPSEDQSITRFLNMYQYKGMSSQVASHWIWVREDWKMIVTMMFAIGEGLQQARAL
jgi:hypothetical protein